VAWSVTITNKGESAAVNACSGGLTNFLPMTEDLGVPVYAIHGYCGGGPVADLQVDDVIAINGKKYQVVSANEFPIFSSTEVMQGLVADIFLLSCNLVKGVSHTLGLNAVAAD
jgi:hypothetical protein